MKTRTIEIKIDQLTPDDQGELWKEIPGYLGFYQVSNRGNVRSLDRKVNGKLGSLVVKKGRMLVKQPIDGYVQVRLCINGKIKFFRIHQLVAICFVENPNPKDFNVINHKDENRTNNIPENLEWCTVKYNNNYGTKQDKVRAKMINGKNSIPVIQYDMSGNYLGEWPSSMEAERVLGVSGTKITCCCKGKRNTTGGFKWKYKEAA